MVRTSLALIALLPALAACSPAVMTELALSDIIEVGETGKSTTVPAKLHIPLPDGADCEGEIAAYVQRLAAIMPASGGTCDMTPGTAHALIETTATVIQLQTERPIKAGLVLEVGMLVDTEPLYELTVHSQVTLEEIMKALEIDAPANDPEIVFALHNDLGREMGVQFAGVFYNDWPAMPDQGMMMEPAETSIVRLSDVTTTVIAEGNGNMFMTLFDLNAAATKP